MPRDLYLPVEKFNDYSYYSINDISCILNKIPSPVKNSEIKIIIFG